jgi:hypothetical protein
MLFLYVDDGAFPFATREEMTQGVTVIFDHFARFGLEMHLGYEKDGKIQPSKTECVFFPPPRTLIRWKLPLNWRMELKLKQR